MNGNLNINFGKNTDYGGSDVNERKLFCGMLSHQVTEEILYELFLQCGPIESLRLIKGNRPSSFAFVIFSHKCSVMYAKQLMNGIKLFNRTINIDIPSGRNVLPSQSPSLQCNVPLTAEAFTESLEQLKTTRNNYPIYNRNNDGIQQGFQGNQNLSTIFGNNSLSPSMTAPSSRSDRIHYSGSQPYSRRSYSSWQPYSRGERTSNRDIYNNRSFSVRNRYLQ